MVLVVAVALIDQQQRVLLAQRPEGKAMAGLWEFPGGKVNALPRYKPQQPYFLHPHHHSCCCTLPLRRIGWFCFPCLPLRS